MSISESQDFVAVAESDELKPGQMKKIRVDDKSLILALGDAGHFAVDEHCSHEDYSLYLGCIKDNRIKCSLHGSYFDLETGTALDEPATDPIGCYPVKIEDGKVWVSPNKK